MLPACAQARFIAEQMRIAKDEQEKLLALAEQNRPSRMSARARLKRALAERLKHLPTRGAATAEQEAGHKGLGLGASTTNAEQNTLQQTPEPEPSTPLSVKDAALKRLQSALDGSRCAKDTANSKAAECVASSTATIKCLLAGKSICECMHADAAVRTCIGDCWTYWWRHLAPSCDQACETAPSGKRQHTNHNKPNKEQENPYPRQYHPAHQVSAAHREARDSGVRRLCPYHTIPCRPIPYRPIPYHPLIPPTFLPLFRLYEVVSLYMCVLPYKYLKYGNCCPN